jgi:hypothetical protein
MKLFGNRFAVFSYHCFCCGQQIEAARLPVGSVVKDPPSKYAAKCSRGTERTFTEKTLLELPQKIIRV